MIHRKLYRLSVAFIAPFFQRHCGYQVTGIVEVVDVRIRSICFFTDCRAGKCVSENVSRCALNCIFIQHTRHNVGHSRSPAVAGQPNKAMFRINAIVHQLCGELGIYLAGSLMKSLVIAGRPDVEVTVPLTVFHRASDGNAVQTILLALIGHLLVRDRIGHHIIAVYIHCTAIRKAIIQALITHVFQHRAYRALPIVCRIRKDNRRLGYIGGQTSRVIEKHSVVVHKGHLPVSDFFPLEAVAGIGGIRVLHRGNVRLLRQHLRELRKLPLRFRRLLGFLWNRRLSGFLRLAGLIRLFRLFRRLRLLCRVWRCLTGNDLLLRGIGRGKFLGHGSYRQHGYQHQHGHQ